MSEYVNIPPHEISNIDDMYGREYDPYPGSRVPRRSNPGPGLQSPRQHGPPITPLHMMPQGQRPNGSGYGEHPRTPMMRSSRDPGTPMMRNTPAPGTPMMRNAPPPGTPMMRSAPSPNTPRMRSTPSSGTPMQRSPAVSNSPTMLRSPATEHPQMMRSPPQTRMRSPQAQNGPMPGAARFRELDSVEPARFTQAPTNVSYPGSQAPSWIEPTTLPQQSGRAESSFFVPRHASTPAPQSRFNESAPTFPGGFREDAPAHFEEPPRHFEEPLHHSDEQPPSFGEHTEQFEPVSHFEGDESYRRDPGSFVEDSGYQLGSNNGYAEHADETRSVNDQTVDFEEELIPASFSRSDGEHEEQMPGGVNHESRFSDGSSFRVHDYDPNRFNASAKPKKGFVGGFFAPFRNIPRMWSSSRSGKSSSIQPMSTTNPSRPTLPLNLPSYSDLHADDPTRPSNPVPETTGDFSRITDTTATSHSGPHTPDQSAIHEAAARDDPGPLPNPYDPSPMPLAQPNVASPEAVVLEQAEDYDAMTEEPSYEAQHDTLGTHINTIGKFVKDLAHLPWINTRATVEYCPSDSRRAYPKKPPGQSWYVKENHEKLDLLAGPTQPPPRTRPRPRPAPQAAPGGQGAPRRQRTGAGGGPQRVRSPASASSTRSLDAATAIRPTTTPASLTTHGGLVRLPSPGASSHGHGQHSYSYAYYSPRPLYVYPAQVAAGGAGAAAGGAAPESAVLPPVGYPSALPLAMPPAEGGSPQAVPVFMLAAPPQYPSPPLSASPRKHRRHHSSRRRHEQKASSSSPPPPMPTPQATNAP